jgi:hypothetical protein
MRSLCGIVADTRRRDVGRDIDGAYGTTADARMRTAQAELARGGQFAIMMRGRPPLSDIRHRKNIQDDRANPRK